MMKTMQKILCAVGIHRWGPPQDYLPLVPDEADCARWFGGDGAWPNYPYQRCTRCETRRNLPKTYVQVRRSP